MTYDPRSARQAALHLAPVALAALLVVQDNLNRGGSISAAGVWWQAGVAAVTAAVVYLPPSAWLKAVAGAVGAVASVVTASLTDNTIDVGEWMVIVSALLAWLTSMVPPRQAPGAAVEGRHSAGRPVE